MHTEAETHLTAASDSIAEWRFLLGTILSPWLLNKASATKSNVVTDLKLDTLEIQAQVACGQYHSLSSRSFDACGGRHLAAVATK